MSLRDYFAAQALVGILHALESDEVSPKNREGTLARYSYKLADAMLKARETKP